MTINIYTDGACSGNPGPGAWAYIALYEVSGEQKEFKDTGFEAHTTNNQMELMAVLEAFRKIKGEGHSVEVHTDSRLVIGWLSQNWKRKLPHIDKLVVEIQKIVKQKHLILGFQYVKGHADNEYNNECDRMAVETVKLNRS
jgi:ribonuclease HI